MKKLLIFIFGLVIGSIATGSYITHSFEGIINWQTMAGLQSDINMGLGYRKELDNNELNKLKELLDFNLKHNTHLLLAMDKQLGTTEKHHYDKMVEKVSKAGVKINLTDVDELVKKLYKSKD